MQHQLDLLAHTRAILKKYENMTSVTGEDFNIFSILKMDYNEVKTHSAFLVELLNPEGSHRQGSLFLRIFTEMFWNPSSPEEKDESSFDLDSARIKKELHVGKKTQTEGGRLDIIIEDRHNQKIIIENKINAVLQENQLRRYYAYGKKDETHFELLYLTLYGEDCPKDVLEIEEKINPISYQEDIINWLEACQKEMVVVPTIREAIGQYIYLIKSLTNQTTNKTMKKEIIDHILQDDNFNAYTELLKNGKKVRVEVFKGIMAALKDFQLTVNNELENDPLIFSCSKDKGPDKKFYQFKFENRSLAENNLSIKFQFQSNDFKNLICGLSYIDCDSETKLNFDFKDDWGSTYWWAAYKFFGDYRSWHWNVFKKAKTTDAFLLDVDAMAAQLYNSFQERLNVKELEIHKIR